DSAGAMYATNFSLSTVGVFGPKANGNVAPKAKIAGANTTLVRPEGIALAPPTSSATLTTATAPSITLGTSTQDVATLSGGESPTGSLIFKLFGPNDSTCSQAPAFTSSLVKVSGNGTYTPPSFSPPATGTYSWVAEYSGDK